MARGDRSTLRYKNVSRICTVGESTLVGASGEFSDFTYIQKLLEELVVEDICADDGIALAPQEVCMLCD